jgi:diacylglycerol kinase family enzyme
MRAWLLVNPAATTTTARTRDVITRALGSDLKVDVLATQRRGHAAELARAARADGIDVVVTLGGDGTVNEVVNGLLVDGPAGDTPLLAVVPGGSTNVFARAVGMAGDPVEATSQILDAVQELRVRRIGLGRAGDRWFTFSAGLGLDAEVVGIVEQRRREGARSTHGLYVRSAVRQFYLGTERRRPPLVLERPGREPIEGLYLVIVQNTAPWTYLGRRAVNPSPAASFDTGLDVMGVRRMGTASMLRHVSQLLAGSTRPPHGRGIVSLHDEAELRLRCTRPVAFQLDGDHLGTRGAVTFTSVPRALGVLV